MDELLRIHSLTVELPTAAGWVCPVNEVTLRIGAQIEEAIRAHEPNLHPSVVDGRMIAALEQAAVPEPDSSPY